jgi:two-component system NtrC family sensor kinase
MSEVAGDMAYALHGIHAEKARKNAEEKLKTSKEQYRSLFEETKDFICICSPKGNFVDINPAGVQAFGYSSKEEMLVLDMEKDVYWNPEEREKLKRMLDETGFIKDSEFEMKNKNGDKLIIRLTATVSKDKNGKVINFMVIGRDITEQKRVGQQLIQTEKMAAMGELMSGVAHEINNPLTAMLGFTELILKTNESIDTELKQDIGKIYDAAMRVYKITTGLLRFARKEKPMKKKVFINKLVEESLSLKEYHLHVKNIRIKKFLQEELPPVNADAKQIEQVFLNILNNAEYAMAEKSDGGCLTIRTSLESGMIKIEFVDTGPGIPEKDIKKIFNPFFTTKPSDKGTGLGLSVSYGIVKEHGGEIYAENGKEDGAVFAIFLPLWEDDGKRENPDS